MLVGIAIRDLSTDCNPNSERECEFSNTEARCHVSCANIVQQHIEHPVMRCPCTYFDITTTLPNCNVYLNQFQTESSADAGGHSASSWVRARKQVTLRHAERYSKVDRTPTDLWRVSGSESAPICGVRRHRMQSLLRDIFLKMNEH